MFIKDPGLLCSMHLLFSKPYPGFDSSSRDDVSHSAEFNLPAGSLWSTDRGDESICSVLVCTIDYLFDLSEKFE